MNTILNEDQMPKLDSAISAILNQIFTAPISSSEATYHRSKSLMNLVKIKKLAQTHIPQSKPPSSDQIPSDFFNPSIRYSSSIPPDFPPSFKVEPTHAPEFTQPGWLADQRSQGNIP